MPTKRQLNTQWEVDFEFGKNLEKLSNIKKTIKKIVFLDFDGSLYLTPEPEFGKQKWKEVTGNDYPHIGWWSKPESLSLEVFNIEPHNLVLEQCAIANDEPNTLTVLLTNRIEKMENSVLTVLDFHNIQLDFVTFKTDYKNKGQRIEQFIEKYNPEVIDFYDDTVDHFTNCKFLHEKYQNLEFNYFLVKPEEIIKILD